MNNILIQKQKQFQQLLHYFASYLYDMSIMILDIKKLAYSLLNITQPPSKVISVTNNIDSIMEACKRTFDDLKRAESILKGHVKGKGNQFNGLYHNGGAMQKNSRLKKINAQIVYPSENKSPLLKKTEKVSPQLQNPQQHSYKQLDKQFLPQSWIIVQPKSQQNIFKSSNDIKGKSQMHENSFITSQFQKKHTSQLHDNNYQRADSQKVKRRVESIRRSRKKQILEIHNGNIQCIDLIKKIKSELKLKKA